MRSVFALALFIATAVHANPPPDDTVPVSNGSIFELKAVPDCPDDAGNHLNYDASTNSIYCGNLGDGRGEESRSGVFIGTGVGFTTSPTAYFRYTIVGDLVTVCQTSDLTGVSNSTVLEVTGVPEELLPEQGVASRTVLARVTNNGVTGMGYLTVQSDQTKLFVRSALDGEFFTASGTKRLRPACYSWNKRDQS